MSSNLTMLTTAGQRKSCIVVPPPMANVSRSVIRYHGNPPPLPSPPLTCKSTGARRVRHEKLRDIIFTRHQEFTRIQKENQVLNAKVHELDTIVKDQDHEAALLRYELEQLRKENQALKAKLPGFVSQTTTHHITGSIMQTVKSKGVMVPVEDIVATSSATKCSSSALHSADLDKEPEIYCVCGVRFTTRQNLREHIKYYSFGMKFRCTQCGIRKHGLNQLRTHMRVTHGISLDYLSSVKGCRLCGQLFTSLSQLHEHRRSAHGGLRAHK